MGFGKLCSCKPMLLESSLRRLLYWRLLPGQWRGRGRPMVCPSIYTLPLLIRSPLQLPVWLHLERQSGGEGSPSEGQRHHSCGAVHVSTEFFINEFYNPKCNQAHPTKFWTCYHKPLISIPELLFVLSVCWSWALVMGVMVYTVTLSLCVHSFMGYCLKMI